MPKPVDVGSVLSGRYKVTGRVLASTDQDLVLDGIDQVLNRPVSILLASPSNASQITASARELATGERAGSMQVLDLGISDDYTYLVTNRAPAADLLDLVIEQNQPYIEPFFTDTLGSEIFGQARSTEPMIYKDDDNYEEDAKQPRKARFSPSQPKPSSPGAPEPQDEPRVSIWVTEDYKSLKEPPRNVQREPEPRRPESRFPAGAMTGAGLASGAGIAGTSGTDAQAGGSGGGAGVKGAGTEGTEPTVGSAAPGGSEASGSQASGSRPDSDGPPSRHKLRRGLIGALFATLLVVAVVLSVSKLGTLFDNEPVAGPEATTSSSPTPSNAPSPTPTPQQPAPILPEATNVLRLVPNNPQLNSGSDGELSKVIDNNPSSYWQSFVFANNTFGGLAQNMALVVELREPSAINQVEIFQLNGAGGNFTVLLNDAPSLDGAEQVGQGSFTGSSVTVPIPKSADTAANAQYVIINFTQLPRLSGIEAQYPWGLRIAEINVS